MSATNTIGNIASVHTNTGDHPTSLEYAFKALASYEELGNLDGVGNITGNIGLTYLLFTVNTQKRSTSCIAHSPSLPIYMLR